MFGQAPLSLLLCESRSRSAEALFCGFTCRTKKELLPTDQSTRRVPLPPAFGAAPPPEPEPELCGSRTKHTLTHKTCSGCYKEARKMSGQLCLLGRDWYLASAFSARLMPYWHMGNRLARAKSVKTNSVWLCVSAEPSLSLCDRQTPTV